MLYLLCYIYVNNKSYTRAGNEAPLKLTSQDASRCQKYLEDVHSSFAAPRVLSRWRYYKFRCPRDARIRSNVFAAEQ